MTLLLFVIHLAATLFMTGVIWIVQVVHYPLMKYVGLNQFARYEAAHRRTIVPVVVPAMSIELVTGGLLLWLHPAGMDTPWLTIAFVLLLLVWISTFSVQVPLHQRLGERFHAVVHRRLVLSNWMRTIGWSTRALILLYLLWQLTANTY